MTSHICGRNEITIL